MTFILGMAGGTASGKTTLAHALTEALGDRALLITHDRYYKSLPEDTREHPIRHNFDHPDSLDTARLVSDIQALREGGTADLPLYDFSVHARSPGTERVTARDVVLIEGILVLADETLASLFDHSVYVHTPDDIRLIRRIRRDMEKRGRTATQVLDQYEATVRLMHEQFVAPSRDRADTVLCGTEPVEDLVAAVMALLPA